MSRGVMVGPASGGQTRKRVCKAPHFESICRVCTHARVNTHAQQVGSWTLGEYAYLLAPDVDTESVLAILCDLVERSYYRDSSTKCYIVSAITKIVAHCRTGCAPMVRTLMARYCSARDPALQQRCREVSSLVDMPEIMRQVLPLDASCEDIEVNEGLPMLNNFVEQALQAGAKRYMTEAQRAAAGMGAERAASIVSASTAAGPEGAKLRFDAYAKPEIPQPRPATSVPLVRHFCVRVFVESSKI